MSKCVLVVLGHPSIQSFCAALSNAYVNGARAIGHDVQVLELGALKFDPSCTTATSRYSRWSPTCCTRSH
ncbi:Flavodoxin-like fold protein [compost metagenome]|jgi:putative NADPH-quinone reductase